MIVLCLISLLLSLPLTLQTDTFPTVEKCVFTKHYVLNHIVFNCTGSGLVRTYKPVGCAPVNDRKSQRLNIGQVHKGFGFLYACHQAGSALEYKPISEFRRKKPYTTYAALGATVLNHPRHAKVRVLISSTQSTVLEGQSAWIYSEIL
uniref:Uncharacterized protein n=1 Tax=Steinernema glaseri TaxID=37863 RepID=A0A1I8A2M0_9BILA